MSDDNKHNILYFESASMKELYETMQTWQNENEKRFLSLSLEWDGGKLCCIALTNPSEVVIVHGGWPNKDGAHVYNGQLAVTK
jgi:hypothetical protein